MKTKKENIVSYTVEELEEMIRAGTTGTDWDRIDRMTQEEINRRAIEDMDDLGIAHDWYKDAQPINLQAAISSGNAEAHYTEAFFASNRYASVRAMHAVSQAMLTIHQRPRHILSTEGEHDSARLVSLV